MMLSLRVLTPAEVAAMDEYWRQAAIAEAWHLWDLASCVERGGHWWFLDLSPDESISLTCRGCSADMADLQPDDPALCLVGEFEVVPGYVLKLDEGRIIVNDRFPASCWEDAEPFAYGWRGPVTAELRVEEYRSWDGPSEYDVFIDVDPA